MGVLKVYNIDKQAVFNTGTSVLIITYPQSCSLLD